MPKPSWITFNPESGTGNGQSTINASQHTGRGDKTGIITGTTTGGITDTSSVVLHGKPEFITVTTTEKDAPNAGGEVTIEGTSNAANLKLKITESIEGVSYRLTVDSVADDSWNGDSDTGVDGDPGANAQYAFIITITVPANGTDQARQLKFTLVNGNETVTSSEVTVIQALGQKTYANPVITQLTYTDIPAAGGEVTPNIVYSQTWGWNGSTTGGGTITSGGTVKYTGASVAEDGKVSAVSLETTVKSRTLITTVQAVVTMNGKSSEQKSAEVYQEANAASYGDVTITDGSVADIPASGGSVSIITGLTTSQKITFTSGASRDGEVEVNYSEAVSAPSLGTTVKERTQVGTLTVNATGEGEETASKQYPVYQTANIATYGEVTINQVTPVSLSKDGQTYQINPDARQTVTYTSGASRTESSESNPVEINSTYEVDTPKTGFSLSEDTVTVTPNPGTTPRSGFVVVIQSIGEGSKTANKEITFNQQGADSTIKLTPETLEFDYTGGEKQLTVESNDSWTLS